MIHINDYPRLPRFRQDALAQFLKAQGLTFESDIDGVVLAETEDGALKGCVAHHGAILKYFCVDPAVRDEGMGAKLVSTLINRLLPHHASLRAFTAPDRIEVFQGLGFRLLAEVPPVYALLEFGPQGLEEYLAGLSTRIPAQGTPRGAIVMNANPFTLGHQYLVQYAAARCEHLLVFVVSEDTSRFSFHARLEMVTAGCAAFDNVTVCPGGDYMVSSTTFPHYFLSGLSDATLTDYQSRLDATLFATRIAPPLTITQRFIGEEPLSPVTACYNHALHAVLTAHGIAVHEIPRRQQAGDVISASRVRAAIDRRDPVWHTLVPETTRDYLMTHGLVDDESPSRSPGPSGRE